MPRYGTEGQRVDLLITQGSDYTQRLRVTTTGKEGAPVRDITGCTIRAQARKQANSTGGPAFTFNCTVVDGLNGDWALWLTHEETAAIETGATKLDPESNYVWDAQLVLPSGKVEPLAYGGVQIHPTATRE